MVSGEIQPDIVYENDHILAFRDITPRAPVHVLVIPKKHVPTLADLDDPDIAAQCLLGARKVADIEGISDDGYRTVINCKKAAGQEVYHLHLHVLGGRSMSWPPG
ncbi:MAG TPA: histidine triad nucleotide-binding protein [Crenotrichaceae bacterium]|nr:histidine triad nucleotide-binding protein [Crenotrichaceae bacterium]